MGSSCPLCDTFPLPLLSHSFSSPVSPLLFCISCVIPFLLHSSCIFHLPHPSSCAPPPFQSLPLYSHSVSHQLFNSAAQHFHLNRFPASMQDRSGARGCILSEPRVRGCHGAVLAVPTPVPWAWKCVPRPCARLGQRLWACIPPGDAVPGAECSGHLHGTNHHAQGICWVCRVPGTPFRATCAHQSL